jgi:anaerobic magnesium-protoporphyrin IX monomethyl ester cyclase
MSGIILLQSKIGYIETLSYIESPPLGLLYSVAKIPKTIDIKLVDQRVNVNWKELIDKHVCDNTVCFATTTATGEQIKYMLDMCKYCKEKYPYIPIILGGIHGTLLPEQTVINKYIDIAVKGEGEETFLELFNVLKKHKQKYKKNYYLENNDKNNKLFLKNIKGIVYKNKINGKIYVYNNPDRDFIDFEEAEEPRYDIVNIKEYLPNLMGKKRFFMQTSRGCPCKCSFCYNIFFNKNTWRYQSAKKILDRIEYIIEKYNIRNFYFLDDNFFIDIGRVEEFLQGLEDRKLKIKWNVQGTRIDSIYRMSDELVDKIIDSGCNRLIFGIETGSKRILKLLNKNTLLSQVITVNKRLANKKISLQYSFMCGLPTETKEDWKKSVRFALKLLNDNPKALISEFAIYTPYPKTPLYEIAVKKGIKVGEKLEDWIECDYNNPNLLTWLTKKDRRTLEGMEYCSLFIDKKYKYYTKLNWVKIIAIIYRPIAIFRMKHMFFDFMILKNLHKLLIIYMKNK